MGASIRSPMIGDFDLSSAKVVQVERIVRGGPVHLEPIKAGQAVTKPYTGSYEFTPGDEAVTIPTSGLMMTQDIVVNPVPSNYGKILWNGSELSIV